MGGDLWRRRACRGANVPALPGDVVVVAYSPDSGKYGYSKNYARTTAKLRSSFTRTAAHLRPIMMTVLGEALRVPMKRWRTRQRWRVALEKAEKAVKLLHLFARNDFHQLARYHGKKCAGGTFAAQNWSSEPCFVIRESLS